MKRLTKIYPSGAWGIDGEIDDVVHRLAAIEDILGDDYELDRLRKLVEADKDGRCVVFPRLEPGQGDNPGAPGVPGPPGIATVATLKVREQE